MAAQKLTDSYVKGLAPSEKALRIEWDTEVKGFGFLTTRAGARSFVLNYRASGIQRRITIGSFPDWSVKAARQEAMALKRRVDQGEDPMADRHADRTAPTVDALAARYLNEHATRKRPRAAKEDESLLHQHILPRFGRLRVASVRRTDIDAFHREISKRTPVRANRALSLLGKMFNLAVAWEYRPDNPCRGVEKNPEQKRERYLTPAELERLMAALSTARNQASANVIRLLLLTGARRGEALGATWDQLDTSNNSSTEDRRDGPTSIDGVVPI